MAEKIPEIVGKPGARDSSTHEEIVENDRPWSNLPDNVLSLIISQIFAGDRVAFQSVCKSWKSVYIFRTRYFQLPITSSDCESPCLLSSDKIFHPIYNERLAMDFEWKLGTQICVAKDDWLLISECEEKLFFLNPFTKTKIVLPSTKLEVISHSMCLSSSPTFKDWQIVTGATNEKGQISICSIKCGEDSWSYFEYPMKFNFSLCNGVIHKGSYYFIDKNAGVLIYNPKKKPPRIYNASKCITEKIEETYAQQYLLESKKGKLIAVFVSCDGNWIRTCQWDDDKKTWGIIHSLGNKMLFVSRYLSLCEEATVQGSGNKIYFPRFVEGHSLFYSLSTKKYHTFLSGSSYNNFFETSLRCNCTWIKP